MWTLKSLGKYYFTSACSCRGLWQHLFPVPALYLLLETEKTSSVPAFQRLLLYLKGHEACWLTRLLSACARALWSLPRFPPSWHSKSCTKPCPWRSILVKKGNGVHKEPKSHYHTFQICNGPMVIHSHILEKRSWSLKLSSKNQDKN